MFACYSVFQCLHLANWLSRNSKTSQSIQNETFSINQSTIFLGLTYYFPDFSERSLVPNSLSCAPATMNLWAFFLATHCAALWLYPPQYKHLTSANLFTLSSAKVLLLPALSSIDAGPVYPSIVPAGAVSGALGWGGGLGEVKPIPLPLFCAAFSARLCRIW